MNAPHPIASTTLVMPVLTKPQWDAAQEAARCLMAGNPNDEADRASFRAARTRLVEMLPDGDASDTITRACHWIALDTVAAALVPSTSLNGGQ